MNIKHIFHCVITVARWWYLNVCHKGGGKGDSRKVSPKQYMVIYSRSWSFYISREVKLHITLFLMSINNIRNVHSLSWYWYWWHPVLVFCVNEAANSTPIVSVPPGSTKPRPGTFEDQNSWWTTLDPGSFIQKGKSPGKNFLWCKQATAEEMSA